MENRKVCFPCYFRCEFDSLQEAVDYVQKMSGGLDVYICNIVMYNVRFRDCLRENGIDGVIEMLIDEAPIIASSPTLTKYLKWRWTERMNERIADYDIQCLPRDGRICVDGCWFDGLEDIHNQTEFCGNPTHRYSRWYPRRDYKPNPIGLHIGNIWKSYPVFDSSDASDDRSYNNYVFSKEPLTESMMEQYCKKIGFRSNACMVHEEIPPSLLPILYYDGDKYSNWVLLASKK